MADDLAVGAGVIPPHPHPEVDQWLEEADKVLEETNPEAPDPDAPDDWADPVEPVDDTIPEPGAYGDT